jgi:leader peptidase (prepilin peptidase) / N-methyltransferase
MAIIFYLMIFFLGAAIGSFVNVLALRLPKEERIGLSRSRCPKCKEKLKWSDLIPIFSFIVLRGECRHCGKKISFQYPLIEMVLGVLFVLFAIKYQALYDISNFYFYRDLLFTSILTTIFLTDLRYYLILDKVSLPGIAIAFGVNLFLWNHFWLSVQSLLLAIFVGAGFFLLQYILSKGRWIGAGDIRLGALMGAMLGFPQILVALFLSYISGAIISLLLIGLSKKTMKDQVPFGVFLSASTVFSLFFGNRLLDWYLSLLG